MVFGRTTLSGLFASALLVANSFAAPSSTEEPKKVKRQNGPLPITGVTGTGVQPRYELRTLQSQFPDMWNMYILGLSRMQSKDQSDYLSWFQLAGIHGLPMMDWNGVQGDPSTSPPSGYCTHVSNMFLSWHRPYMALYEQAVQQNAMEAANEFSGADQQKYVAAAQTLRTPYWDWAMNPNGGNAIPDSMTTPSITVVTPSGQQTIDNPLYSYKFHSVDSTLVYSPYTYWDKTYRHPQSQDQQTSNNDQGLIQTMNGQQSSLGSRLFTLFSQYENYMNVSNEAWYQGMSGSYDSIESVHDTIHGLMGGPNQGDMSVIDVSAFDPAFWLHHTMVDRFFAMWQTLYPDSYVEPANQVYGNYWYTKDTELDAGSPLFPFHADSAGNFHTSNSVRDFTKFGYTYPELVSGNVNDVVSAINTLYGAGSSSGKKRSDILGYVTNAVDDLGDAVNGALNDAADIVAEIGSYLGVSSDRDYIVNIRTDKNAAAGSYFIYIFIGEPSQNPSDWATDDALVGIQGITSMMDSAGMGSAIVAGTIPLTRFLEKHVVLKLLGGLTEDIVVPYLTANLQWRVLGANSALIDPNLLPDLKIGVVSTEIQKTNSLSAFPKWVGSITQHTEVTSGRPNGLCDEDEF